MAYEGYLVKIKAIPGSELADWDYTIPMGDIVFESYQATYSTLDGDSKRNGKGRLRRTTYPHRVAHCKFTLRQMKGVEIHQILELIQLHYVKKRQRKVKASIWVPELDAYVTDYYYLPDPNITIKRQETTRQGTSRLIYNPVELELIGY